MSTIALLQSISDYNLQKLLKSLLDKRGLRPKRGQKGILYARAHRVAEKRKRAQSRKMRI